MSELTRREKIEAMLAEDPSDTFLQYSLAMELQKEGRHAESLSRFEALMTQAPPHVPAFFMSAKLLVALDRRDEARAPASRHRGSSRPERPACRQRNGRNAHSDGADGIVLPQRTPPPVVHRSAQPRLHCHEGQLLK